MAAFVELNSVDGQVVDGELIFSILGYSLSTSFTHNINS
jgi:hypothetical protein